MTILRILLIFLIISVPVNAYKPKHYMEWTKTTIDGKKCKGGLLYISGFKSINSWWNRTEHTSYSTRQYYNLMRRHRAYLDSVYGED